MGSQQHEDVDGFGGGTVSVCSRVTRSTYMYVRCMDCGFMVWAGAGAGAGAGCYMRFRASFSSLACWFRCGDLSDLQETRGALKMPAGATGRSPQNQN